MRRRWLPLRHKVRVKVGGGVLHRTCDGWLRLQMTALRTRQLARGGP
jgi:hypothetical protein